MCAADWARERQMPYTTIVGRWRRGVRGEALLSREKPDMFAVRRADIARRLATGNRHGRRPACSLGAQLIFDCIVERRLTYRAAAEAIGVSFATLGSWLRGVARPCESTRNRVAAWSNGAVRPTDWDGQPQKEAV